MRYVYHFKTKDEILDAVIDARLGNTRDMLAGWEVDAETPAARIRSFIHILIRNRDKITGFGCPVGTLTAELSKSGHAARPDAAMIFTLFHIWLRRQFQNLGHRADADRFAMELLLRSQGAAVLASAFGDESILQHAVTDMCGMLDNLTDENHQTSDITEGKPVL